MILALGCTSPVTSADGYLFGATTAREAGNTRVVVAPTPNLAPFDMYMVRIDGDSIFQPFGMTAGGGGPVVAWLDHGNTFGSGNGDWLDGGRYSEDGYTFIGMRLPVTVM